MEEEISIREYIEILLKWKWFIAGITIAAMLVSGLYSFLMLTPQYETRVTLLVNQVGRTVTMDETDPISAVLQSLSGNVAMTLETYRQQVKNPFLLQQVIDKLELDPEEYDVESLTKRISVEAPADSNLIRIIVKGEDPREIADIADALADAFVNFINDQSRKKMAGSSQILGEQVEVQEEKLDQVMAKYRDFLAQSPGVEELQKERDSKIELLTSYKTRLISLDVELNSKQHALTEAHEQLAETPEKLVTSKSLSDDPYLQDYARENSDMDAKELAGIKMSSEVINPLYSSLKQSISSYKLEISMLITERKNLTEVIAKTAKDLDVLQLQLSEKKAEEEKILTRVDDVKSNYNLLSSRFEESKIASTMDTGQALITKIAPAMEPINPVGPRKMLNIAIAMVLGGMVSVFIAYFREYWVSSDPKAESKSNISING